MKQQAKKLHSWGSLTFFASNLSLRTSCSPLQGKKEKKEKASSSSNPSSPSPATGASTGDVASWRTTNKIVVIPPAGAPSRDPFRSFADAPLPSAIQSLFSAKGFERPSPIQAQCWPVMMAGDDVVGIAETGSGKTLAFSVPFLSKMERGEKKGKVREYGRRAKIVLRFLMEERSDKNIVQAVRRQAAS